MRLTRRGEAVLATLAVLFVMVMVVWAGTVLWRTIAANVDAEISEEWR